MPANVKAHKQMQLCFCVVMGWSSYIKLPTVIMIKTSNILIILIKKSMIRLCVCEVWLCIRDSSSFDTGIGKCTPSISLCLLLSGICWHLIRDMSSCSSQCYNDHTAWMVCFTGEKLQASVALIISSDMAAGLILLSVQDGSKGLLNWKK